MQWTIETRPSVNLQQTAICIQYCRRYKTVFTTKNLYQWNLLWNAQKCNVCIVWFARFWYFLLQYIHGIFMPSKQTTSDTFVTYICSALYKKKDCDRLYQKIIKLCEFLDNMTIFHQSRSQTCKKVFHTLKDFHRPIIRLDYLLQLGRFKCDLATSL